MQDSLVCTTLDRAVTALELATEDELQSLPLFDSAMMLDALPNIEELIGVRRRIAELLRQQVNAVWIEDADAFEVFSALAALWKYDQAYITAGQLTQAIQRLVCSEIVVGGPYYSKAVAMIPTNIQIALFVRRVTKPLPNMTAFFADVIAARRFSNTKLTVPTLLYLLMKADVRHQGFSEYLTDCRHQERWQTSLGQAVILGVLKNTINPGDKSKIITSLCQKQQPNGLWAGESLYRNKSVQAASSFVTTALIVEALVACSPDFARVPHDLQNDHRIVAQSAYARFGAYTEPLRSTALAAAMQVCAADKDFEIALLPWFFGRAMKVDVSLTDEQYVLLGCANVCGWIAYSIYDDFLDNEGSPEHLPVANVAMRTSLECFKAAISDDNFQRYTARVFAEMDQANAWEIKYCRFGIYAEKVIIAELPQYGRGAVLAARSFAHALAPMAISAQSSMTSHKSKQCIEAAFRHYLIARQLNDDMHDWLDDARAGQASYVVTAILRDLHIRPGEYNLNSLLVAMQKCFRQKTMPKLCQRILRHIDLSRQYFAESQLLHTVNNIYILLDKLELSVKCSRDNHAKAQALATIQTKKLTD